MKAGLGLPIIGIIIMATGSGCDLHTKRKVVIDQHTFNVPEKYLLRDSLPWIPGSKLTSLSFVANPDAPIYERNIVTVESSSVSCHPATPPTSNMLSAACLGSKDSIDLTVLRKVFPHEGITFEWEYQSDGSVRPPITVASCSSINDGRDGLCTSIVSWKGLICAVRFRDSKIKHLPELWSKAAGLLEAWENHANTK